MDGIEFYIVLGVKPLAVGPREAVEEPKADCRSPKTVHIASFFLWEPLLRIFNFHTQAPIGGVL